MAQSTDRGEYRAIHTVLLDSPEFLDLSPGAQLVFFHLKLRLGATGIDVLPAAEAQIAETTGLPLTAPPNGDTNTVANTVRELIRTGWLKRERNVLWLRNGLRYEPSRSLNNEKNRKGVENHISTLPKLKIVNDFAEYYGLEKPFPEEHRTEHRSEGVGNTDRTVYPSTDTDTENVVPPSAAAQHLPPDQPSGSGGVSNDDTDKIPAVAADLFPGAPAAARALVHLSRGELQGPVDSLTSSFLYPSEENAVLPDPSVLGGSLEKRRKWVARALVDMRAAGEGRRYNPRALAGFVRKARNDVTSGDDWEDGLE